MSQRVLTTKHARLVDMRSSIISDINPLAAPGKRKRSFFIGGLAASLGLLITSAILAAQGIGANEKSVFIAINGVDSAAYIEAIARFSSDFVWVATAIVIIALVYKNTRATAYKIAVLAVLTNILVYIVEHVVGRGRPGELLADDGFQRAIQDGFGYPSSHTATITIIMLVLWPKLTPTLRFGALISIVLVAWSRIFLGVHLPLDVIGGFACASTIYFAYRVAPRRYLKMLKL